MILHHPQGSFLRSVAGFSLIEALIAALVLATGLMALAALQGALTVSAADARARSQVAAFTELVVERQRSAGMTSFANIPSTSAWTSAELSAVQTSAGVSNLQVSVTATHYRYDATANSGAGGFITCDTTCAAGLAPNAPQYKEIRTVATWTDATGTARRYDATSTISPRTIQNNDLPYRTATSGASANAKKPIVRTPVPSDAGVIPIAIGSNTDTAATNPKPKVSGTTVIRTSFEVLTYKNETSSAVQQKRVETAVIGCKCRNDTNFSSTSQASNPQFSVSQWPAYWNGTRYVVYEPDNGGAAPGASLGKAAASVVQDELCLECCRDHHDTSTSGVVKFDPFRFAENKPHTHYKRTGEGLVEAGNGDIYEEACRMIRVDGFWRVAADFGNQYFNFLATADNANSYDPSSTAQTNYQNMVLGYLNQRYTNGTAYNTALSDSAVTALETTHSINTPTSITMPRTAGVKWLHTRGLYVDYLEPKAIEAITNTKAKSDCAGAAMSACVLPLLPITAINLTELTEFASASTVQVVVENQGFNLSTLANSGSQAPRRGKTTSGSNPTNNTEVNVSGVTTKSNSGLAAILPIDNEDVPTFTDVQKFTIQGDNPPSGTGGDFFVTLDPYTFAGSIANYPVISFTNTGGADVTCTRATTGASAPNPYKCTATKLGEATAVKLSNYNYQVNETSSYSVTAGCTNNKVTNLQCTFTGTNGPLCGDWAVTIPATGVSGSSVSGSRKSESTLINFSTINASDQLTLALTLVGTGRGTTDKVNFQCNIGNGKTNCGDATLQWIDPCL